MKRRIMPLLLTLCLLLGLMIPAAAEDSAPTYPTENGFTYMVQDKAAVILGYADKTVTELTIPEKLGGYPVSGILESCFIGYQNLKKVILPDQELLLGVSAFENCTALEEINLHDGIDLGASTFAGCTSLKAARLPTPKNPYGRQPSGIFTGCTALTDVEIGEGLALIPASTFDGCTALKEVSIPEGVLIVEDRAFQNCKALTAVELPISLDVVHMDAFEGCSAELSIYGIKDTVAEHAAAKLGFRFVEETYPQLFRDVQGGTYYSAAVDWAAIGGITLGKTDDLFAPNEPCTRAQMVTFLWRFVGSPDPETKPEDVPFTDLRSGAYYEKAVIWAYENGVTNGSTATTFNPNGTVTRAQVVAMLCRLDDQEDSSCAPAEFTDLREGAYYMTAVNWAAAQGIVTGYADGTFRPDAPCTRAHIVTFLYRNTASYYNSGSLIGDIYIN